MIDHSAGLPIRRESGNSMPSCLLCQAMAAFSFRSWYEVILLQTSAFKASPAGQSRIFPHKRRGVASRGSGEQGQAESSPFQRIIWFISKIGSRMETTIDPTARPITVIIRGSSSEVMPFTAASTSRS